MSLTMEPVIKKDSMYNYRMDTNMYTFSTDVMLAYLRKQLQWQAYNSATQLSTKAQIVEDSYLMNCVVILQETPGSCCFGLNVVCYGNDDPAFLDEVAPHCIVAKTTFPRHIKKGSIVIRVLSSHFTADVTCGECANMTKFEHEFCGQSFEKQFACITKDRSLRGLFGKVLLDHVDDAGKCQSIFELNMEKVSPHVESTTTDTTTDSWSTVFMKELAGVLNMSETDDIAALMKRLGFTTGEVHSISQSENKFHEILTQFRSRGGTPEELLQKLYETKRFSVFEDYVNGTRDCYDVIKEQTSFSSMIPQRGTPLPRESEDDDGDTIPAEDTCCFSPVKIPTTPPPMVTPLKKSGSHPFHVVKARRLSFEDDQASSADTVPVEDLIVEAAPAKAGSRKRCLTEASIGPFSLKRARPSYPETDTTKSSLEVELINGLASTTAEGVTTTEEPISPGVLRDIAFQIEDDWKIIGRVLEVPEAHLSCLEVAHSDTMERCVSMLKSWVASEPELCHRHMLHEALVHTGHDIIADKYL